MQDSSSNPYIPQESEQIRQKVYARQSPLGRTVKWSLIITVIVAVLVGIGLFFVVPRTTAVDDAARQKLADALQPPEQTLKRVNVQSQLGFSLNYDNHIYSSYAEVGDSTAGSASSTAVSAGQTYENNDLRVARDYNYVRIRPVESVDTARGLAPIPPELELFATFSDKDLTTAAAVPENKGKSKLSLFVKLDGDKRLAQRVLDDNTVVTIDISKAVSTSINGVDYQKVRYTTTNDNHRVSNVKYNDCYYTIQYNQPYSICISDVRPTSVSAASLVEQVFDSITYQQSQSSTDSTQTTDTEKTTSYLPLALLTQATTKTNDNASSDDTSSDGSESPLLTITPEYYKDADSLSTIAKGQPSVVRVGTIYCADLALKYESGDTATTLTDACVGNLATGTFISKDGYVATTGHAIRTQKKAALTGYINGAADQDQMLDRLQHILDYLLKSKLILQSDADYLKTGASTGDQEALAKIENIGSIIPDNYITAVKEEYTYAVQPSDKPIVINRSDTNKPSFAYSDSVLGAKYVASDYDAGKSVQEDFGTATPTVDVGLLKVDGDFQDVAVAKSEDMKANDILSTIGYPSYTDSSLTVDKIRNLPIVTMNKVDQAYKKDGTRLIQTDVPVLPGNDGAPVFDSRGQLVGMAVYGLSYCPDQQCFANGTVRSSAELVKLLDENNIKLSTDSTASLDWREGVTQYFRANYTASLSAFTAAGNDYAFNRWAEPLQKLASAGQGTASDTSLMNQLQAIMVWVLGILVVVTVLLVVALVVHRRRISQLQVGHYGEAAESPQQTVLPPSQPFPVVPQTVLPPPVQNQQPPMSGQPGMGYPQPQQPVQPQSGPIASPFPPAQGQTLQEPTQSSEDPFYK